MQRGNEQRTNKIELQFQYSIPLVDKITVWDTSTQLKEENLMKEKREEMLRVKEIVL